MEERLETVEAELELLAEAGLASSWAPPEPAEHRPSRAAEGGGEGVLSGGAALVGRTLLVLGGGYLIRALTEAELLPRGVGIALGLAYALLWVGMADRSAAAGRHPSATFHGLGAGVVAFPLLWESTTRFGVLSPTAALALVALVAAVILAAAGRQQLVGLAWVATSGTTVTAVAILVASRAVEAASLLFVAQGIAVLWLARSRSWPGLAALSAGLADVAVLLLGAAALTEGSGVDAVAALTVQLSLFTLYLGSFLVVSLARDQRLDGFAAFQSSLVTVIGFGGAALLAHEIDPGLDVTVGLASLALGLAGYGLVVGHRRRWAQGRQLELTLYGFLSLALVATGSGLLVPEPALAWCVLAVLAGLLAHRLALSSLTLQASLYLLAAAVGGSLLRLVIHAFGAPAGREWPQPSAAALATIAAAALCAALPLIDGGRTQRRLEAAARTATLAVLFAGLGGAALSLLVRSTGSALEPDGARLSTLRTGVLAALALGAAALSRNRRLRDAARLTYPLLLLGGLKLIVEDFVRAPPRYLVVALALYATALIAAPRIRRSRRRDRSAEPSRE